MISARSTFAFDLKIAAGELPFPEALKGHNTLNC